MTGRYPVTHGVFVNDVCLSREAVSLAQAFAGTGYRELRREDDEPTEQGLLFPDLAEQETQELLEGSAKLALRTNPRFDKYLLIERNVER